MEQAVFQIKQFRSLLKQRELFFQVTISLELFFLFLTVLFTQKAITNSNQQDCVPTGKAFFFYLVRTLRNQD